MILSFSLISENKYIFGFDPDLSFLISNSITKPTKKLTNDVKKIQLPALFFYPLVIASFALIDNNAFAQDQETAEALDPSLVIGDGDVFDLPGSGYVIDTEELRLLKPLQHQSYT